MIREYWKFYVMLIIVTASLIGFAIAHEHELSTFCNNQNLSIYSWDLSGYQCIDEKTAVVYTFEVVE